MSRRRAEAFIELRTSDGFRVLVEAPSEEMIRAVFAAIGEHAKPRRKPPKRPDAEELVA